MSIDLSTEDWTALKNQVFTRGECDEMSHDIMASKVSVDDAMSELVRRLKRFPCMIIWDERFENGIDPS
jgi:hypothetical protein